MKQFWQSLLSDIDGQPSSKRLASFLVLLLILVIAVGVTFFHATLNQTVWDDLLLYLSYMFGWVGMEKFSGRFIKPNSSPSKTDQ